MVNRNPRAGHAIDEALSLSATILRILGKLNSKAAKVRKTRAGKGHRGAGWPTKARAAVPVSGTPPAAPPDKTSENNNEDDFPRRFRFPRLCGSAHRHAGSCGGSLRPQARPGLRSGSVQRLQLERR